MSAFMEALARKANDEFVETCRLARYDMFDMNTGWWILNPRYELSHDKDAVICKICGCRLEVCHYWSCPPNR